MGLVLAALIIGCSASTEVADESLDAPAVDSTPTAVALSEDPTPVPPGPCGPIARPRDAEPWPIPRVDTVTAEMITDLADSEPSTDFDPSSPVVAAGTQNQGTKFVVGPAWPIVLDRVEPTVAGGANQCAITIVLSDRGLVVFNQLASICFNKESQCPTSQLAVVADGEVLFSPVIASPTFDSVELVFSGPLGFRPDEAETVAQSIATSAQFRPVLLGPIPIAG